ncbi:hypothetical protein Psfp_01736 [Pelotomaculum sp. FP]|nr:hypothetical protein Psfp_01736 [Pelotomaculum sp. FP]
MLKIYDGLQEDLKENYALRLTTYDLNDVGWIKLDVFK